jgi:tRNA A37 threonylcarbamoyladenosine modification protein TsaB
MSASNIEKHHSVALAIELSNPSAAPGGHASALFSIADEDDLSERSLIGSGPIPEGVRSSDGIMVLVESLCAQHQVGPCDIKKIIVSNGPGGYTALRISTTTAKVLAQTIGCELVAVPTARIAAASIDPQHKPALIALASKNELAHCSVAHANGLLESVGVIDADRIKSLGVVSIVADSHLPRTFVDRAEEFGIAIHPIVLDARLCLEAAEGVEPTSPIDLAPIYAREPDAVTQWRSRTKK